ncbi:kinase-like domain-containing protein [Gorgonomyces haynaldii]|nr:kinase-like domain-containing protein [Gorgonomyces haynaldii]
MCNLLLEGDLESSERNLKARCYGVLPFGDNFGMIQWIDKSTGLFPIYRKWSLPQDKFTEKIQKAIEDNVIQKKTPRHQWPMDLLLTIHRQLKQETPQDLVYKELWTTSLNPMTLLKKQAVFARSLGVMSMIGHILGLGDRHLDNILLDIQTGEIIHIDFNVCFDKGKRLRVPETVPFRLTQNLVHCLGFTGVEGKFRIACEHALSVMQQSSEMLIVLLEAFLYDPLVDWTSSHSERRLMHLNANLGLLSSRMSTWNDLR